MLQEYNLNNKKNKMNYNKPYDLLNSRVKLGINSFPNNLFSPESVAKSN